MTESLRGVPSQATMMTERATYTLSGDDEECEIWTVILSETCGE